MKYYSEKLNKPFDTVEELEKAENELSIKKQELNKKKEERKNRVKEVGAAFEKVNEDQKKANKLLNDFIEDYGSYHTNLHNSSSPFTSLVDFIFN